jgi:outer membrane lipoprotein-sorting protein
MERMNAAFYYPGRDMKVRMRMELVDRSRRELLRVMTLLRRNNAEGPDQKYLIYFEKPGDVRRTSCMVWKHAHKEDDRWIYVRAVDRVRRVIAPEQTSFLGSDFTREDLAGRNSGVDADSLLREERLKGRPCYVVRNIPLDNPVYARRVTWVDKENFLPLRIEYLDQKDAPMRVFTADTVEVVKSHSIRGREYPTVTRRTMTNTRSGHRTEMTFEEVAYDLGLTDGDFTESRMRQEPVLWIP